MIVSSGIACGVLLGVIEGVGVLMQRMFAEGNREFGILWIGALRSASLSSSFCSGPVAPMVILIQKFMRLGQNYADHAVSI